MKFGANVMPLERISTTYT